MSTEKQYAPHEQRVVDELKELQEKLRKLMSFLHSTKFFELSESEQSLLLTQSTAMNKYSEVLAERIANF